MSKFFKALEQAERERALQEEADRQAREPELSQASQAPEPDEPSGGGSPMPGEAGASPPVADSPLSEPLLRLWPEPDAVVGGLPHGVDRHLVSLLTPISFEAEQYRTLRHAIEQLHKNADLHMIAVSSPTVGDGKTVTAINLAGSLAQAPKARVLLVEADLRRPSVIRYLGLGHVSDNGLVDAILRPNLLLDEVITICPAFNFAVLPAGRAPAASYELLKSPRLEALLKETRQRYDYIVVDTPPLIPLPDCRLIGKSVDGFLLVVAAHKTPRKLLEEALNVLDPTKIVGLIFNGDDRPPAGYYDRYDQPTNGQRQGRLGWVGKALGDLLRLRRSSSRWG